MAETTDQIRQHIESRRVQLARDINELEQRVRETVDWRRQYQRHAGAALGVAFGAGVLLGLISTRNGNKAPKLAA